MYSLTIFLQVVGGIAVFSLLAYAAVWAEDAFQDWQLKRNRVHDDLSRHERELKELRNQCECNKSYIDSVNGDLGAVEMAVEGLKPADKQPGAEEIPEAITISEVPKKDRFQYFLDYDGDVWRWDLGEQKLYCFHWGGRGWVASAYSREGIVDLFDADTISAAHGEALTE